MVQLHQHHNKSGNGFGLDVHDAGGHHPAPPHLADLGRGHAGVKGGEEVHLAIYLGGVPLCPAQQLPALPDPVHQHINLLVKSGELAVRFYCVQTVIHGQR